MENSFFQIQGVNKTFGGLIALDNVNLSVEQGTVHAIIGPNGAGKSTLLNCCIGKLKPDTGTVTFDGRNVIGKTAYEINQIGIARVFQTPEIFPELSLIKNVMIPAFAKRDGQFKINWFKSLIDEDAIYEEAVKILDDFGLKEQMRHHAGNMSRGDKRRLELAMSLIQHPKLLLLDEPTAGMARHDTNKTIETLKKIKKSGMTKIIIEHDMHVVFSLADKISVLAQGAIIAEGTPDEIKGNPVVQEAYLGGTEDA
ncbi:MAG: ABC transporter ATP-binding protein [gamma proteobacterium symbiont of Taylorina sp.]|nr:ABC transporter ATP-binding protein [gamma proteobacterium symbiont of Taylorina sp.]